MRQMKSLLPNMQNGFRDNLISTCRLQVDLNGRMRAILVDWLVDVSSQFQVKEWLCRALWWPQGAPLPQCQQFCCGNGKRRHFSFHLPVPSKGNCRCQHATHNLDSICPMKKSCCAILI